MRPEGASTQLQLRHHVCQFRIELRLSARQYGCDVSEVVQRQFQYCVIDEVDSILVDEARTPLILSGPLSVPRRYQQAAQVSQALTRAARVERIVLILKVIMR